MIPIARRRLFSESKANCKISLDEQVVERDAFDKGIEVLRIAGQALSGRRQALVEELVVALVGVGPDLDQQLAQVLGVSAHDLVPPPVEENGVTRLVDHLRRQEDLDLGRRGGPDEWRQRRRDALLAVEEQAVRPQSRFAIHVFGVEPVLAIEGEIEIADSPLLVLPPPVQVHVAGHVLDASVDEGEDVVDPDVAELL